MHCLYGGYNLHRFSDALGLVSSVKLALFISTPAQLAVKLFFFSPSFYSGITLAFQVAFLGPAVNFIKLTNLDFPALFFLVQIIIVIN